MTKADFFVPENAQVACRREHLSPSGKYKLIITPYATSPGCWTYSQGLVYRVGDETLIAEVQRNYSSFFFSFVEDHPNGHQYLVTGEDYQGQTVIELDTGRRRDFLPEAAAQGCGFCWAAHKFDSATCILTVAGCFWACPYEYRVYDFSDPIGTGWPELVCENEGMDDLEYRWPDIEPDGTIKAYQPLYVAESDDDTDDDAEPPPKILAAIKTFKREGLTLKFLGEWVSDEEQEYRRKRAEAEAAYKAKMAAFKATDPLYLKCMELCADPAFSPEEYLWVGVTHQNWCPTWQGDEQRAGKQIAKAETITVKLEWGMVTGPVKIEVYKEGKKFEDKWFPHSVEGMVEAFDYAKEFLTCSR